MDSVTVTVLHNALSWASRLRRGPGGAGTRRRRDVHRFDGERAFVARGGATVGDVKATWSMAELAISSTSVSLHSRPGGLFGDVTIDRRDVDGIGVLPGELGTGITFGDARPDVIFWPTDTKHVLIELRERGWPLVRGE